MGQLGSSQRPVALFTRCALSLQALHTRALPEQSSQRGSSQRRHSPLMRVRSPHWVQRVRPGDTIEHSMQSGEQRRHVFCGVITYRESLHGARCLCHVNSVVMARQLCIVDQAKRAVQPGGHRWLAAVAAYTGAHKAAGHPPELAASCSAVHGRHAASALDHTRGCH